MSKIRLGEPYVIVSAAVPHSIKAKMDEARKQLRMTQSEYLRAILDQESNHILSSISKLDKLISA